MPIDIASGTVTLDYQDFLLPGAVDLVLDRHYSTGLHLNAPSQLGKGWTARYFATLARTADRFEFVTPTGVTEVVYDPDDAVRRGGRAIKYGAFLEIVQQDRYYVVQQWDGETGAVWRYRFGIGALGEPVQLVSIEDVTGQALDVAWDEAGRIKSVRQRTEGSDLLFSHGDFGLITSVTLRTRDGRGMPLARYEYDAESRLVTAYDPLNTASHFEYDSQGRIRREITKDSAVFTYRYDPQGRCVKTTGLSRYDEKRLRFAIETRITYVTDSYNNTYVFEYLPSGQITRQTDPLGGQQLTEYDEYGRIVTRSNAVGATVRYTYDVRGNVAAVEDALGVVTRFTYNEDHLILDNVDPSGMVWRRTYDRSNRLVQLLDPAGAAWSILRDDSTGVVDVFNPLGHRAREVYVYGLLVERSDWLGNVTRFGHDPFGRVTERQDPTGQVTRFRHDVFGNQIEVTLPDGVTLRTQYDHVGNLTSFSDGVGNTHKFRYGPCSRLLESTDPVGATVRYEWGTEPGRLDRIVNEKGETYSIGRDELGRIVEEVGFDGRVLKFGYDAAGRCVQRVNGNDESIKQTYDLVGRLTERRLSTGGVEQFAYDSHGWLVAASDRDESLVLIRDHYGRVTRETQSDAWVDTTYNAVGDTVSIRTSFGHQLLYEVDPNGMVRAVRTEHGEVEFRRDALGQEVERSSRGIFHLEQQFDTVGRLVDQQLYNGPGYGIEQSRGGGAGRLVWNRRYEYNRAGNTHAIFDSAFGSSTLTYDSAGRLLTVSRQSGSSERFDFDISGNITRMRIDGLPPEDVLLTYGPGNRLERRGAVSCEYDKQGRLIRRVESLEQGREVVWTYEWDALDRLVAVVRPDGVRWLYRYDPLGRRVEKISGTSRTRFVWDKSVLIHELEEGDWHRGTTWVFDLIGFSPICRLKHGNFYEVFNDHSGSPAWLVDETHPVGRGHSGTAWGDFSGINEGRNGYPFGFQGQYYDKESSLYYNWFRYYDASAGRYISQDTFGIAGSINFYFYAPNPFDWYDPFGLVSCRAQAAQNLRDMGLEGVTLAGASYNRGRGHLQRAGFNHVETTATGRQVFQNSRTGARVFFDSGAALVGNQRPHWHITDAAGNSYDRSGRVVPPGSQSAHIPAG
jgi:RHS repeat-associated protein